jgi:hypothetical protein
MTVLQEVQVRAVAVAQVRLEVLQPVEILAPAVQVLHTQLQVVQSYTPAAVEVELEVQDQVVLVVLVAVVQEQVPHYMPAEVNKALVAVAEAADT